DNGNPFLSSTREKTIIAAIVGFLMLALALVVWNLLEMPEKNINTLKSLKVQSVVDPKVTPKNLVMEESTVDDQARLDSLRHPNAQSLNYKGYPLTDRGVQYFCGMKHLRTLNLQGADVTDAGLANLEQLPLVHLFLPATKIGDAGLKSL